jgi:hypothetical protein
LVEARESVYPRIRRGPVDPQEEHPEFVLQLVPVQRGLAEHRRAAAVKRILPIGGMAVSRWTDIVSLLQDYLSPRVGRGELFRGV